MFHRTSHRASNPRNHFVQSSDQKLGRAVEIECLEIRRLLVVYSPAGVPLISETAGSTSVVNVATFASESPIANLTANVSWPGGTTTSGTTAGTIINTGSVFIPGIGVSPEYTVQATATFTGTTGTLQPQFVVSITDSTGNGEGGSAEVDDSLQVVRPQFHFNGTFSLNPVTEGTTVDLSGAATPAVFYDTDPTANPGDFTANIDWGDGTTRTLGTIVQGSPGGPMLINASHTFKEAGQYTITYDVKDTTFGGSEETNTFAIEVDDAALSNGSGTSFTGTEGQTLNNVLLGTFSDANPFATPADFTASVDWADGSASDIGAVQLIGGDATSSTFGIYGSHTYAAGGTFNLTIDVADKGSSTLPEIDSTATISDPAVIAVGGRTFSATQGKDTGDVTLATFTDPAGPEDTSHYSATIDWGDGSGADTASTITVSNGVFTVTGDHTFSKSGTFHPVIVVSHDAATDSNPVIDTANVAAKSSSSSSSSLVGSAVTFSGFEGRSATTTVAKFTASSSTSASSFTASINWGDGQTSSGKIVKDSSGKYHVTGSHAYAEEKSSGYAVKVTIKQTSNSATITVNSTADIADSPLDQAKGVTFSESKNTTFSNKTLGTFRDQDALNTQAGDYVGTIDWGDGKTSAATFVFTSATANNGSFWKVTGGHKYSSAKTYTVKITLHDTGSPGKSITITSTIKVS